MTKKRPEKSGPSSSSPTFAEARERLDRILRELEEGQVDVDLLADRVEQAAGLVSICRARLGEQEARLRKVAAELSAEEEAPEDEAEDPFLEEE